MKSFIIYLLLLTGFSALAQKTNLNMHLNDNGKTYSIQIDGKSKGQPIHYRRTFDVAGMSKEQKEELKNRVLDSLGLRKPSPRPAPPGAEPKPGTVKVTFTCPACAGKTKLSITGDGFSVEREVETDRKKSGFPFELDMPPGEYRYTYRQNKVEQMNLPFMVKAGQINTVMVK